MLTGKPLGDAIRAAIKAKKVTPTVVAKHFGIRAASVHGWIKTGRIGKDKIDGLIAYFADTVGPGHWGLVGVAAQMQANAPGPRVQQELALYSTLPETQREFLELLEQLAPPQQQDLLGHMRATVASNEAVRKHIPGRRMRVTEDARIEATYGIANDLKVKS